MDNGRMMEEQAANYDLDKNKLIKNIYSLCMTLNEIETRENVILKQKKINLIQNFTYFYNI